MGKGGGAFLRSPHLYFSVCRRPQRRGTPSTSKAMDNAKNTTLFPYLERLLEGEEVEWKTLGEVAEFKRGQTITQKTAQAGVYPVISGGQQPAYYIDQYNRTGQTITVAGSGAYAGFVMFWNEPIFVSDAFSIKANEEVLLPRYVFHFLLNKQNSIFNLKRGSGVPHVYAKDLAVFSIPIPPLRVQARIVEILDKFTQLEAQLEVELEARKKQYAYYRDQLLNFSQYPPLNVNIEWKTLGEVAELIRGNGLSKKDFSEFGIPAIHYGQIYTYYGNETEETLSFVSPETAKKLQKVYPGNIVITNTSENIEDVCKSVLYSGNVEAVTGGHATIIRPKDYILSKYLVYYTLTLDFFTQKKRLAKGTKVIDVSAKDLAKIVIPLPPLSEQRRIVDILDRFDTLTNSISEGLPKEIALRRKQYEYYRDALLSFPRPEVSA